MAPSLGASTTEMKSMCPSVAHWAFTLAPSCSTSLLTSLIRSGLFLTVWTPSGVSVVSMMYVGIESAPPGIWRIGWARSVRRLGSTGSAPGTPARGGHNTDALCGGPFWDPGGNYRSNRRIDLREGLPSHH